MVKATRVFVEESYETFSEFHLSDGTILAIKASPHAIYRLEAQYDPLTGDQIYSVNTNVTIVAKYVPEILRRENQVDETSAN